MRIGIDARLLGYRVGGIPTYIRLLLEHLADINGEEEYVAFLSRRYNGPPPQGGKVTHRKLWTPPHHPWEQLTLPLELMGYGLDILHSPDFIPPFRRRWRAVITIHDLAFLLYPNLLTKESAAYYGQVERAVREADLIIAVSENTKRDLLELLGAREEKIRVIYEAPDPIFQPIDREYAASKVWELFGLKARYILFVGTIEPRKNLSTLLEALAQLKVMLPADTPKLAVAGDKGWLYQDSFRKVEELGLQEDVRFLGPAAPEQLLFLYNGASVLVHPALYEGFGLVVLEAMACGTPVIASNCSSLPEVVGDGGLLVDPQEAQALAKTIYKVLTDKELWEGLRARALARAREFSWQKTARRTRAAYQEALG